MNQRKNNKSVQKLQQVEDYEMMKNLSRAGDW